MTVKRVILSVAAALGLGMIIAMLGGRPRQVSVALWMSIAVGWLSWLVVRDLLSLAPVRPDKLRSPWRRGGDPDDQAVAVKPRELTLIEGMLASARSSPRAATLRLRPRLRALTGELLGRRHGIEVDRQPERAIAVLGDVAWLVNGDETTDRAPTPAEVDTLVSRAMTPIPTVVPSPTEESRP